MTCPTATTTQTQANSAAVPPSRSRNGAPVRPTPRTATVPNRIVLGSSRSRIHDFGTLRIFRQLGHSWLPNPKPFARIGACACPDLPRSGYPIGRGRDNPWAAG